MTDLILFDEKCPFCQKCVSWVIEKDKYHRFLFSDLQGLTAQKRKNNLHIQNKDTVILVERFNTEEERIYYRSQTVFKVFWNLGGFYKLIGWKYILPSFMLDWAYRLIARHRKFFCKNMKGDARASHLQRFLP